MSTDMTTEDVLDVFEEVLRLARVGLRHEEKHGRGDDDDDPVDGFTTVGDGGGMLEHIELYR